MAFDILKTGRAPLHVSGILDRINTQFGVSLDRGSLVSSLTKTVARGDRFLRPEKNTSSTTHLPARGAASGRIAGPPRAPLFDSHRPDQ